MNIPVNLKYTREHEWLRAEGNEAVIGITAYAQKELGEIVYVEIETEDEKLLAGDKFGTIEAVKTVSDLYMPVGGTVSAVNPVLAAEPYTVNKDPYGEGWLIRILLTNPSEVETLISANEYMDLVQT